MTHRIRSVPMIFNHVRFGNDILARRLELHMTCEQVAELCNFEQTTLSKYERATEPSPKIRHFLAACNVYDLDPRDYFELER